jgi:5'(3')-deoxyribonucleotidase
MADIAIDLDGVVYDFVAAFRAHCVRAGIDAATSGRTDRYDFYLDWGLDRHRFADLLADAVDTAGMWREGEAVPGALAALSAMAAAGHRLHLVTNRLIGVRAWANTEAWLATWNVPYCTVTFAADKTVVLADWFIDDCPDNVDAVAAAGRYASVFTQPWNQDWDPKPGQGRLASWPFWENELCRALLWAKESRI